ncbi:phage tail protein [Cloacibacillus sp. An23]|uniref:phage tail protein n=1 Tax=Cloacibacillus sp. An23 TaxID=1965591 RepID=UPI000B3A2CD6|nr:phage tail protein [Cloacibacillus sp. An23]OUO94817.1 hypothetical protein B5F39_02815 [Cloacibacillus sp. An23]
MPDIESYGVDEYGQSSGVRSRSRVGDIVFSPRATPRAGTLVCDGSAVSRQTYKELFDFLGVSCGAGDGETTFNLPDLRDVWILCAGTEHEAGDRVAEGLPNLTGQIQARNYSNNSGSPMPPNNIVDSGVYNGAGLISTEFQSGDEWGDVLSTGTSNTTGQRTTVLRFNAQNDNDIYGASDHVTPKSVVLTPCIIYE